MVDGHTTVESKRSGLISKVIFACGLTVATLSVGAPAHASPHQHGRAGISANPDKKAEAKAAREKKKAERSARKEEKLAKAKSKKDGDKVAKADKPMNDDMGGSDDPLEGL
jgi:hypothetical protein